tara:strand:+ start:457 stop:870 length:414 start_codon:yes stop_codon:yes gene_type:complete
MSGIVKTCRICKADFVTRTIRAAKWQKYCDDCYTSKRLTSYQQTAVQNANFENSQIEKDIEMIKTQLESMPNIIKLEVNHVLEKTVDSDFLNKTREELHQVVYDLWIEKTEEDKQFKEKMQRQLLALNNKILELMKK